MKTRHAIASLCFLFGASFLAAADPMRQAESLEEQLSRTNAGELARQARLRGDARRGALVFYRSAAGCVKCHGSDDDANPLGPDLSRIGKVTDQYVVESLLDPSKSIKEQYQTHSILTEDGEVLTGLIIARDDESITIRSASDLTKDTNISTDEIVRIKANPKSLMPERLVASLSSQRNFYDLVRYVIEVASGGPIRAAQLKPTNEQLMVKDDSLDLDHAGIIKRLRQRDFDTGKGIYDGYCFNCHGTDGNHPSLPTARAFGSQKLKFGSDPYRMFMTLTRGNGLMAPMSHLTPKERYQVVHYIREQFMKPTNPDYFKVDNRYYKDLPQGTKDGTEVDLVERDYGPALASQLRRDFSSVLNVKLGDLSIAYDLHSMDQADLWRGGFLDLSETQHARPREKAPRTRTETVSPA